jgi:hypothetical protein
MRRFKAVLLSLPLILSALSPAQAAPSSFTRESDLIYDK